MSKSNNKNGSNINDDRQYLIQYMIIYLEYDFFYSSQASLDVVEQFDTYEDYLDSQLTETDLGYLEDEDMARQLVELGYRGLGDTIRREVGNY